MTTFVGIVEEPESGTVTVGMANEDDGSVTGWSFEVERAHLNDYYVAQPDGGTSYQLSPDVARLGGFLQQRISDRSRARFLVEVPDTIPHPANDPKGIPHPVVPADSVILKVLVFLGVHGYVAAPFQFNPDRDIAVIFPILPGSDLAHLRSISPKYLPHGICKAYGQLLSLDGERPEHIAIVGALIAKNAGAYHYWSSIGLVQSSQDVLQDLRSGYEGPTRVLSAQEDYIIEITVATVRDAIDDVPLEYALGEKRYEHLGPDANKAALIHVCKRWGIILRCKSDREDAEEPGAEGPVYPLGTFESIILGALQHAERENIWPATPTRPA